MVRGKNVISKNNSRLTKKPKKGKTLDPQGLMDIKKKIREKGGNGNK